MKVLDSNQKYETSQHDFFSRQLGIEGHGIENSFKIMIMNISSFSRPEAFSILHYVNKLVITDSIEFVSAFWFFTGSFDAAHRTIKCWPKNAGPRLSDIPFHGLREWRAVQPSQSRASAFSPPSIALERIVDVSKSPLKLALCSVASFG